MLDVRERQAEDSATRHLGRSSLRSNSSRERHRNDVACCYGTARRSDRPDVFAPVFPASANWLVRSPWIHRDGPQLFAGTWQSGGISPDHSCDTERNTSSRDGRLYCSSNRGVEEPGRAEGWLFSVCVHLA